jgi:hypothetical protein
VALVVFSTLLVEYFIRFFRNWPVRAVESDSRSSSTTLVRRRPWNVKLKLLTFGLIFSSICLFIRYVMLFSSFSLIAKITRAFYSGVYRTIELAGGWNGRVISTQVYFSMLKIPCII